MMLKKIILFIPLLLLLSCSSTNENQQAKSTLTIVPLSYAKRFTIKTSADFTVLELHGNKNDSAITAYFVLYKHQKPDYSKEAYYIKTPISRVASMSSIYTTMIAQLKCEDKIIAIDNVDYYNNPFIQEQVKKGSIIELSKGPQVDIEKTIALQPDLFLTFGMGSPKDDVDKKLVQSSMPIAVSIDHLEETPLARAEWIKFFACFFNKESLGVTFSDISEKILKLLEEKDIKAKVTGREKTPFSIWRKIQSKRISLEQITDIVGFRVILDNTDMCYRALGIFHTKWSMVPGRFKDYISVK